MRALSLSVVLVVAFFAIKDLYAQALPPPKNGRVPEQELPVGLYFKSGDIIVTRTSLDLSGLGGLYLQAGEVVSSYKLIRNNKPYCWFEVLRDASRPLGSAHVLKIKGIRLNNQYSEHQLSVGQLSRQTDDLMDTAVYFDDTSISQMICRRAVGLASGVSPSELLEVLGHRMTWIRADQP